MTPARRWTLGSFLAVWAVANVVGAAAWRWYADAAVSAAQAQAPVAGERRGHRCFNGNYWTDCEPPAPPPQRLQVQAVVISDQRDGWHGVKVQAVCDSGNGTMLYVVQSAASDSAAHAAVAVPGGCAKAAAEQEKERVR